MHDIIERFSLAFVFVSLLASAAMAITYPDTSLPLSANTTVTPDAPPTNTTSINVSTSTDFQGTLAGDPTTGVVHVTDAHPAGSYIVTVAAFGNRSATPIKPFKLTVTTPATCSPVHFAPAVNYQTGPAPYSVAVGDFNSDGRQDLAVANANSTIAADGLSIFLGNGDGTFSAPISVSTGFAGAISVVVGDFNGDGKQDLAAVIGGYPGFVAILLGDGNGNFLSPQLNQAGDNTFSAVVGDFNGDKKQDLAVTSITTTGVSVLLGDGAGNFGAYNLIHGGHYPVSMALADFNRDGKQDLAVADEFSNNSVAILFGDGAGNFISSGGFHAGNRPNSVAAGDFNADGKQDLAVANSGVPPNVSILLGDGAGNFSPPRNFAAGDTPISVVVGDFNGDGIQDLVVVNLLEEGEVSILLGDGTGHFSDPITLPVGDAPISVAVGDFNGDGMQDLAVTNANANTVSILLRDCQTLTPQCKPNHSLEPCAPIGK